MLPKGHLSHSQINMMLRCGQQYYHHYIRGLSSPPGWALVRGDALDAAVEADMSQKMITGTNLSKSRYQEIITAKVETKIQEVDTTDQAVIDGGGPERIISDFISTSDKVVDAVKPWADEYHPTAVQKTVAGEVGGYPVLGYIDLRSKENVITDTKFFTKKQPDDKAQDSNQLRLYQILERKAGEPAVKAELFGIYPVRDGYKPQTVEQTSSPEAELRFEEVAHNVGKTIEAGIFAPVNLDSNLSWVCSQRYCGFYRVCPYGQAGRRSV